MKSLKESILESLNSNSIVVSKLAFPNKVSRSGIKVGSGLKFDGKIIISAIKDVFPKYNIEDLGGDKKEIDKQLSKQTFEFTIGFVWKQDEVDVDVVLGDDFDDIFDITEKSSSYTTIATINATYSYNNTSEKYEIKFNDEVIDFNNYEEGDSIGSFTDYYKKMQKEKLDSYLEEGGKVRKRNNNDLGDFDEPTDEELFYNIIDDTIKDLKKLIEK